jgi:lysophospholipase L1-like esterase
MKRAPRLLLILLYLPLATFLLLEIVVRSWGYAERYLYDPVYRPFSTNIAYVLQPNLDGRRGRGLTLLHTDELGLRSTEPGRKVGPRAPGEFRVAITGDSITFGEGVRRAEDTYPEVLRRALDARQPARTHRVFNFACSAYSVKEMAFSLRERMPAVQPDLVVMAIFAGDFDLRRTPVVDAYGYHHDAKRSGFAPPDAWYKRALRRSRAAYLLRDLRYALLRGKRHHDLPAADWIPESYAYVRQFHADSLQLGVSPLVVLMAQRPGAFGGVPAALERDGIPWIDLTPVLARFPPEAYQASRFDHHPSAAVHQAMGEELADILGKY